MKIKNNAYESNRISNFDNITRGSSVVEHGWKLLTTFEDGERIMETLLSGGSVFLVRPSNLDHLTTITGDDKYELQEMKHFHLIRISSAEVGSLSLREKEVLELLASGLFYGEVGKKLDIGLETVRTHVKNICSKMHVRNRVEAVAKYMSACCQNQPKRAE
jgi:NarL family two-component system response regulator LiaR